MKWVQMVKSGFFARNNFFRFLSQNVSFFNFQQKSETVIFFRLHLQMPMHSLRKKWKTSEAFQIFSMCGEREVIKWVKMVKSGFFARNNFFLDFCKKRRKQARNAMVSPPRIQYKCKKETFLDVSICQACIAF